MKEVLDVKDRKILYALDCNSRQSISQLAKKVALSKEVVHYRIKRLEKEKYINGYYTLIDFSKLGYFSVRMYLKYFDTNADIESEITDYLTKHKKVFYAIEFEGNIDAAFAVLVKSIYEFEDFYFAFKKKFKQYIKKDNFSIFTLAHHFHRAYLLNKKIDDIRPEVFGKSEIEKYDLIDIKILRMMAKNARMPIVELSQKLKIPARTVAFRIKQLEKKKIIQGYRFIFNFQKYGYQYYKVDLILKDISRLKSLVEYCHTNPNILYIDQMIGGTDFEFDLEVKNKEQFLDIINDLRDKFPEIREWSYFSATKAYAKLEYFPEE